VTSWLANPDGQIPFRTRIGVTGHRDLSSDEALTTAVREQIRGIWLGERLGLPSPASTPIAVAVVSALAEGADRVVVREALAEGIERAGTVRVEAILPMRKAEYVRVQGFSEESRSEFMGLVKVAAFVNEVSNVGSNERYRRASRGIVNRCDVLLALWDGRESGGAGGTAETLLYAASRWHPCIWICTESCEIRDNLEPGTPEVFLEEVRRRARVELQHTDEDASRLRAPESVLASLAETFTALQRFNEERLPWDFTHHREGDLAFAEADGEGDVAWVLVPQLRAARSAIRCQSRFRLATAGMALLAILAACALAANVALDLPERLILVEVGLLLLLLAVFWLTHLHFAFHRRWLSYRLLAERLRSLRFVAPTGVNFPRMAGLRDVYVERQSAEWVERAFEEVWDSRPQAGRARTFGKNTIGRHKERLATKWIQRQIDYHHRSAHNHDRLEVAYRISVFGLFALAVIAAVCHALGRWKDTTAFLSIVAPVAAAAVGAVSTVRQHRALAERSSRMETTLEDAKHDVLAADDSRSLQHASAEAARIMAGESGDWFGAMWFLDIEHPP
jgi:hypothetical protein